MAALVGAGQCEALLEQRVRKTRVWINKARRSTGKSQPVCCRRWNQKKKLRWRQCKMNEWNTNKSERKLPARSGTRSEGLSSLIKIRRRWLKWSIDVFSAKRVNCLDKLMTNLRATKFQFQMRLRLLITKFKPWDALAQKFASSMKCRRVMNKI